MHKIVVFDGYTLNPGDLNWDGLTALGDIQIYDRTPDDKIVERGQEATIVVANKTNLNQHYLEQLPRLQYVCVSATGYNNVDIKVAKAQNILVSNVVGYSTDSVAQQVFSFILYFSNMVAQYNQTVQRGDWQASTDWCYWDRPLSELMGKTIGIFGFGKIGKKVAHLAHAFGMNVIAVSRNPKRDAQPQVRFVDEYTLFRESDYLTLHAPLTSETKHFINVQNLSFMKSDAVLINTGRGGLVHELDLKEALLQRKIRGAALDVLSAEPPHHNHPLIGLDNCIITPHQAWASTEARQRLMDGIEQNVKAFIDGYPINLVGK